MKKIFVLILSIATPLLFIVPPARALETNIGGINMQKACEKMRYARNQDATAVMGDRENAYSWKCKLQGKGYVVYRAFDLNAACKDQYISEIAYAKASNMKDAYSWQCYEPGFYLVP